MYLSSHILALIYFNENSYMMRRFLNYGAAKLLVTQIM